MGFALLALLSRSVSASALAGGSIDPPVMGWSTRDLWPCYFREEDIHNQIEAITRRGLLVSYSQVRSINFAKMTSVASWL
jgi:hypothetical protein